MTDDELDVMYGQMRAAGLWCEAEALKVHIRGLTVAAACPAVNEVKASQGREFLARVTR
jgi:hypothetical protein